MQQHEVDPKQLRRKVEAEFLHYAATYVPPPLGETVGVPWSKDRVDAEVQRMASLIVDPYVVKYFSGDDLLPPEQRLIGERSAFVVAEDESYLLLYDFDAENFVLATKHNDGQLSAWGIRGDAASTFLAR
ncbi:MAG TPA: hypothetical protein VFX56_12575 [Nitrospira sp.]|nr:hypothetical protein [Nitrospira sp.]